MRKKLLAVALSSVMAMSLFTACGSSEEGETTTAATTKAADAADDTAAADDTSAAGDETVEATTTVKPVTDTEEAIDKDPIYSEDFNGATPAITVVARDGDDPSTGANAGTLPTADAAATQGKTAILTTEDTKDGSQVLSLDGTYGATLNVELPETTSYTVSFWINAARYSQYGTMLTVGKDLLATNNDCAWVNMTKVKDWLSIDMAPVIWSRSMKASYEVAPDGTGEEVWPWYVEAYCGAADGMQMTSKEWHHVVLVIDGATVGWDPVVLAEVPGTVQGTTYIDGQLFGTGPVANYTMDATSAVYLGINCWDVIQKAYYDDIQVYDYALTAGQVFGLYNAQKGQ